MKKKVYLIFILPSLLVFLFAIVIPFFMGINIKMCIRDSVLFVALSAYDDFEFVKESLKKGAVDYILKYEMQEDEIRKVILQVKELLDKKNLYEEKSRVLRSTSALSPEIRKALLYMQENYCEDIGLGEVADHIGLNKNYFSNLFKGETGENFVRYLNRLRVSKAAVLLEQKNMKIYEAAEKVGYHNACLLYTSRCV